MTSLVVFALLAASPMAQRQVVRVNVNVAPLRVSASADGRVIATLNRGAELEVFETVGSWYRVRVKTSGVEGYVSNSVVEAVAGLTPTPASAAPVPAPARGPAPRQTSSSSPERIGVRAYAAVDLNRLAAQKSFDAVLGTSQLTGLGGGADVLNVWKTLFVRVSASRLSKAGNRAFVFNGQAVSLGIPITVQMTPIEVGAGWRFVSSSRVTPYIGGGALFVKYAETSQFAGSGDDVSQSNRGYSAFAGADVTVASWLVVGAEGEYRSVPHAIGTAPVSQDFGETNLGGFTVRVLIGFKTKGGPR
jgi:opacity protein-like surface antigen